MNEQSVWLYIPLSNDTFGEPDEREHLRSVEEALAVAVDDAGVGEVDGHEFGGGEFILMAYGPDAHRLLDEIRRALSAWTIPAGGYAMLRLGDDDAGDGRTRADL